jgi:glutathione S-transferase
VLDTLTARLCAGPYLLGEKLSAADILWALSLRWITTYGLVPELPEIKAYVERVTSRPKFQAMEARDAELAAQHAKAVGKG